MPSDVITASGHQDVDIRGGAFQANARLERACGSDGRGQVRAGGGHSRSGHRAGSGDEAEPRRSATGFGLDETRICWARGSQARAGAEPAGRRASGCRGRRTGPSRPQPGSADVRPSSRSACCPRLAPGTLAHAGGAPRRSPRRRWALPRPFPGLRVEVSLKGGGHVGDEAIRGHLLRRWGRQVPAATTFGSISFSENSRRLRRITNSQGIF